MTERASVLDNDLLNLQLKYGKILPWLVPLLEEIQALRDGSIDTDYVDYLETMLDSLDAKYDKESP